MNNKKQSSIEWFYQRILANDIKEVFEQAKAMHKEEIAHAYNYVSLDETYQPIPAEDYYKKRFGG